MTQLNIFLQSSLSDTSSDMATDVTGFFSNLGLPPSATTIIGGIATLIIGFFLAKILGGFASRILRKTGIDEKLKGGIKVSTLIGKLVYFLIMIIVLMTALNIMGVASEVLAPLNQMVQKFLGAIPNILTAGIIIYAGYFLAKILSEFVGVAGEAIENLTVKLKLPEGLDLVKILKSIVFIIVFVPVLIVGLDFLHFDAITKPATGMLSTFMNSIPKIVLAVAIVLIAVFGGKVITGLLKDLLSNLKVNDLSEKLGISSILGNTSLSGLIANLVMIFIVYSGIMEALNVLGLTQLSNILNDVVHVAGKVIFGLLILVLGNVVANFAIKIFANNKNTNQFTLAIMKGAIIVIFLAMGLSAMDIADSIINLAFGLGLGAIAVAFALSFGLGGKEAAGEEMKKFFKKLNDK